MKLFIKLILLTSFIGCNSKQNKSKDIVIENIQNDSVITTQFYPKEIITDTNLVNGSGHRLFVLYNSVNNFFPRTDSSGLRFSTECMPCEPIQVYNNHLVFGAQLQIFDSKAIYHNEELTIPSNSLQLKRIGSNGRGSKPNNFKFSSGSGQIEYIEQSCNDAELNVLTLTYKTGQLKIKNLLNAAFFEFDQNKDGVAEQYILATRNCSQELAIFKIE